MLGAVAEASALDAYYEATNDATQLVEQNLRDKGIEKWERALKDVAPHISSRQLNKLRLESSDIFQPRRVEKTLGDDTDSDSSERGHETEGSDNGGGNVHWAEHMKLTKRHTMWPHTTNTRMLSRSSTISNLERRGTGQVPRTNFSFGVDRPRTTRGGDETAAGSSEEAKTKESIMSSERMAVSEPTVNLTVSESSSSGRNSAQSHSPFRPSGLMGTKEDDNWFRNLKSIAHNFVYGEKREFWPNQPVKVAILDSGFALAGEEQKAMKPYSCRIRDKKTFTREFPNPKTPLEKLQALNDPVGHGTTVAYQLMRTCPSAHVYIAKVTTAESNKKAVPDKGAVVRAIRHAAKPIAEGGWDVDIINMSFGWDESELPGTIEAANGVSGAIKFAESRGVLLFAAASNYGLSELNDVFYPARDPRVISVDAEDGLGNPAHFALRSLRGAGGVRYCAPGLSVESPVSAEPMCGSSFACPVAAGVAALVLEFARHKDVSLSKCPSVKSALSSARGMLKVFGPMSQQAANHPGFNMLYPWHFLRHDQREKVAYDIIDQLRIEFGKENVGKEVRWATTWQPIYPDDGN